MAPRRSTRLSTEPESRASSVAPPSAAPRTASKRKRTTSTAESDYEEKENVSKPPSTRPSRRSTSATPTASRARSSRSVSGAAKATLQQVAESDEEQDEEVPAKKKARPSHSEDEASNNDDDDEIEEIKPKRKTKAKAKAKAKSGKEQKALKEVKQDRNEQEEELEDVFMEPPKTPTKSRKSQQQRPKQPEEDDAPEESLLEPSKAYPTSPLKSLNNTPSKSAAAHQEPEEPKSRLVIHKLALVNFKSYAGRQEIGPFHKSFSAIVGPNGSGKSNTIDALLFVFGYRASKMRQGKLSELIHNSAKYPDLDFCTVEVHFREIKDLSGPDEFEVIPNSNLVVARHAYKNNSSKYTINDKSSTFSEVQTLLKGRGIDLDHKRFLILQGEVESIAQMPPKSQTGHDEGLLEYLEDIIGTDKYKQPIEEANTELEQLHEVRVDKLNRLRIVEKDRDSLREKKKEAEDFLKMQNDLIHLKSFLWQYYIHIALQNENKYMDLINRYQKKLDQEAEKNKDDIEEIAMLEEHCTKKQDTYAEVEKLAREAHKDLEQSKGDMMAIEERKKHADKKIKGLEKSITEDEKALKKARITVDESTQKVETETANVEVKEAELAEAEEELAQIHASLEGKTKPFREAIEKHQRALQPWRTKINEKQSEVDVSTSERDALKKKADELKEDSERAIKELEELRGDLQVKKTEKEKLEREQNGFAQSMKDAENNVQSLKAKANDLRNKATTSRDKLQESRRSQESTRSQNKVLDSLTKLKQQGRMDGFQGRLGSLGTIAEKYDIAVTTAGPSLNNMIVDDTKTAEFGVNYLRTQSIGRATFMPLDKLTRLNMDKPKDLPPNTERLFDLIKPKDPKYAPAFFKAVSNTIVTDTLPNANKISSYGGKRWRVVTLTGQIVETSGTMSGGGGSPMKGGMSSKLPKDPVSPDEIARMDKEAEADYRKYQDALGKLREAEEELDRLVNEGPRRGMELKKLAMDVNNLTKRIDDEEKRVKSLQSRKLDSNDVARIKTLEKAITTASAEFDGLKKEAGKIEAEIKALEEQIVEIGGVRALSQKSKAESIKSYIEIASSQITKAEVAITQANKDIKKYESSLKTNTGNLKTHKEEHADLVEQLSKLASYVSKIEAKEEEARQAADEQKEELKKLKDDLDKKRKAIQGYRKLENELKAKIEEAQTTLQANREGVDYYQDEVDKLRLEEIDDDDDDDDEDEDHHSMDAASNGQQAAGGGEEDGDGDHSIKPDPDAPPKKARRNTSSDELKNYSEAELDACVEKDVQADIHVLEEKIERARPDLTVLKEWKRREAEFDNRAKELDDVTKQRDKQKEEYERLRTLRLNEFMKGFSAISGKLKEMYQMITLGGIAELELVDSMDPFAEGVVFSVMPPKKSWKLISNLSGGEKTLSSLALVFALHVFKPTPLYFMDEIDAALDFRNVSIVANYIKDRTKNAQFIIISLRNDMFELSHRLIGIYKTANATKSIAIDNRSLSTGALQSASVTA